MENIDHVLIVDDDRGIRELIAGYLEKNGMRVSLAANGRQMRAVLEQGAPDLIVLDLASCCAANCAPGNSARFRYSC
jgi:two-component system OmpR family response regulator